MSQNLDGKVAVISGGGGGMMRDIAATFVQAGARVVLADQDREKAELAADGIGRTSAAAFHGDLSSDSVVRELVLFTTAKFGSVDLGVNSVGQRTLTPILEETAEKWALTLQQHLTGTFLAVKYQAIQMIAQGTAGSIINISSISGVQAMDGFAAYGSSKAGVIHLTKIAAIELGPYNIRVNSIAPGQVRAEGLNPDPAVMADPENPFVRATPLRRTGRGDDIASVALFLASSASDWITGQVIPVDGGISVTRYPSYRETPRNRP